MQRNPAFDQPNNWSRAIQERINQTIMEPSDELTVDGLIGDATVGAVTAMRDELLAWRRPPAADDKVSRAVIAIEALKAAIDGNGDTEVAVQALRNALDAV